MRRFVVWALVVFALVLPPRRTAARERMVEQPVPGLAGVHQSGDQRWLFDRRHGHLRTQANFSYHVLFTPNDPQYSWQWHFPAINLPSGWEADAAPPVYGGDPNIVVAILDTGLAYETYQAFQAAPDLASTAVWTNSNEVADGLDNDGNGLVDDVHGWDFVNNDAHPNDDHGHGTHVAGTIAESTNNSLAGAGIAFNTTIMPLKVLGADGNGSTATISAAIAYAVAHGVDIINLSLGGNTPDDVLHQTVIDAVEQGVVVIAAAGNDTDAVINYPAHYDEVIAVGATQFDNSRAPYSDTGPELDVVAPGGNLNLDQNADSQVDGILQQTCTNGACNAFGLYYYQGTSQAAAHVSGVAALLEACGVSGGAVASTLKSTATDLGPAGVDNEYGAGLINVAAALASGGCQSISPIAPGAITAVASSTATRPVIQHRPQPYDQPQFQWAGPAGAVYHVAWGKISQTASVITTTSLAFVPDITSEGSYTLSVTAIDGLGRESTTETFTYRYRRPVLIIGQTSGNLGIRLYSGSLQFIRQWRAGLGTAVVHPVGGSIDQNGTSRVLVTGQAAGRSVKVKTTRGLTRLNLVPFGNEYTGNIDAAVVERRGQASILVFSTRSADARLVWTSPGGSTLRRQTVYRGYRGGLELASGDLDGDGTDEVVVAMSNGHEIRVYNQTGTRLAVFSPLGKSFTRGWAVTTGDRDGDGHEEIILAPRQIRDATTVFMTTLNGVVVKTFRLRLKGYTGPIELASLDVDGDGRDEIFAMTTVGRRRLQQLTADGVVQKDIRPKSDSLGGSLGGWQ